MFKLADRVKETTVTQGTGSILLAGSFGSFQTFSDGIGNGNSTYYTIENNRVTEVIVGNNESTDTDWEIYYSNIRNQVCKRTSYNTMQGVHNNNGIPFRMNYAAIGYLFREDVNSPEGAFVPPCPGEGYTLDENTGLWVEASAL